MQLFSSCLILLFSSYVDSVPVKPNILFHQRALSAAVAIFSLPFCSVAEYLSDGAVPSAATSVVRKEGKVTSEVYLDVSVARGPAERITLGVFGDDAPAASKFFLSICKGDYGEGVSYDGAQVSRIQTDKRIDVGKLAKGGNKKQETWMDNMGKVRIRSVSLASKATHNDQNDLLHDAPGVLSVKRGGGTFDFTIAPQLNPALDGENVVIGKVLRGMDVVDKINKIPVSKEDLIGSKGGFSALGKGFDGRAKLAAVERPLQRISILQCQVEEKASISSFLKF
jgi:peptidyl-prolyl cis-trans isomerase B (cyclophilin B)